MLSVESGAMPFGWHVAAGDPGGQDVALPGHGVTGVPITAIYLGIRG